MTGGCAPRRDLVLDGIDGLPPGLAADLVILDLDYDRMRRRRLVGGGAGGRAAHLEMAGRAIKRAHDMAGVDGICCAISRDVRDAETGSLAMLGTKIVDNAAPWTVSDEIIWSAEPQGPWLDAPGSAGDARDSFVADFSQIWILAKNNPAPSRSAVLGRAELPEKEREEAILSVSTRQL